MAFFDCYAGLLYRLNALMAEWHRACLMIERVSGMEHFDGRVVYGFNSSDGRVV